VEVPFGKEFYDFTYICLKKIRFWTICRCNASSNAPHIRHIRSSVTGMHAATLVVTVQVHET
jgi:CDGSH-type Zn-finger protein